jgi:ubiquinone/menaquinone biosynthesis C-methylase UbiE/uncharacterized protein YbaR (Trm112 family)
LILDWLLRLLRCPTCGEGLVVREDLLVCTSDHTFSVVDGLPILLSADDQADEATQHQKQREFYNHVYAVDGGYSIELWQRAYVERLRPLWSAAADAPFLDIGAGGDAYTVIEAARSGLLAIGCDLAPDAMRRAQRLAASEGLADRCAFIVCVAEHLPFASGAFGSASAIHVLEHLNDDRQALAEFARISRRGAQIFIGVPNSIERMPWLLRPVYARHDREIGHLRQYTGKSLQEKARAAGFRPTRLVFSAHWVKVWQLLAHLLLRRLGIEHERLWWWFESIDVRGGARENGLHLNLFLERS